MLGPLERYMTCTLDAALLSSSRAGADLGGTLDFYQLTSKACIVNTRERTRCLIAILICDISLLIYRND